MQQGEDERRLRTGLDQGNESAVPGGLAEVVGVELLLLGEILEGTLAVQIGNGLRVRQDEVRGFTGHLSGLGKVGAAAAKISYGEPDRLYTWALDNTWQIPVTNEGATKSQTSGD